MRVGISLLTLVPGELGGSETYARGLTRALSSAGVHEYTVFAPPGAHDAAGGLPVVEVGSLPLMRRGPARVPALRVTSSLSHKRRRASRSLDVLHYPLTVPIPRSRVPDVVTLHDVQHHDLPELFTAARRTYRGRAYDRAARNASAVIVPSAFVRARAVDRLQLDQALVHVIPHGVDHALFRPGEDTREPFLLYPAHALPHKNHAALLEAFALLRTELPELRLVLTGSGLGQLENVPEGVELLGIVAVEELASLYRTAACLVFPSLYEGFGLPPLEAMATGCPVAASNVGAVPEVCGEAAVFFDPGDPAAIANGVREALALADELHELGIARAARFTWEESARRHDAVYGGVASGPSA